jgi:hypothetical protein
MQYRKQPWLSFSYNTANNDDSQSNDNIGGGLAITGLVSEANFECSETGIVSTLYVPRLPLDSSLPPSSFCSFFYHCRRVVSILIPRFV